MDLVSKRSKGMSCSSTRLMQDADDDGAVRTARDTEAATADRRQGTAPAGAASMKCERDADRHQGTAGDSGDRHQGTVGDSGDRHQGTAGDSGDRHQRTAGDSGDRHQGTAGDSGDRHQGTAGDNGDRHQRTAGDSGDRHQRTAGDSGDSWQEELPAGAGDTLSHVQLTAVVGGALSSLLSEDPLLSDLAQVSLTPPLLRSLIALEHGTAMAVLVNRSHQLTRVIVERTATVRDLKMALQSTIEAEQRRGGGPQRVHGRAISWRHVWRRHWLSFGGKQLRDDAAPLTQLGIGHKSEVCFVQRIRRKRGQLTKKAGQLQD